MQGERYYCLLLLLFVFKLSCSESLWWARIAELLLSTELTTVKESPWSGPYSTGGQHALGAQQHLSKL